MTTTVAAPERAAPAPPLPPPTAMPSVIPTLDAGALVALERTLRVMLSPLDYGDWRAWRSAVHDEVMELSQARFVSIALPMTGDWREDIYAPLVDQRGLRLYAEDLRHLSRRFEGVLAQLNYTAADEYEFIPDEMRTGEFYGEIVEPFNLVGMSMCEPDIGGGALARMHLVGGRRDLHGFDANRAQLLRTLTPAFRAGAATWRRLGALQGDLARVVDAVRDAVFIYDAAGHLQHANPSAARLTSSADGARIGQEAQQVAWAVSALHRRRRDRDALGAASASVREVRTASGIYKVKGALAGEAAVGGQPMTLVTVEFAQPEALTDAQLRERFSLTEREVGVARLVAAGLSNQALADRLGVSFYTARNHVERLLSKMSAGNRARVGAILRGE